MIIRQASDGDVNDKGKETFFRQYFLSIESHSRPLLKEELFDKLREAFPEKWEKLI